MASLSFAESQPPVNDEEEHPSLQEDEVIDLAKKAFEPKERHRTTTHTGGGRSAEALNNPECFEQILKFLVGRGFPRVSFLIFDEISKGSLHSELRSHRHVKHRSM